MCHKIEENAVGRNENFDVRVTRILFLNENGKMMRMRMRGI